MPPIQPPPLNTPQTDRNGHVNPLWGRYFVDLQQTVVQDVAPADAGYVVTTANPSLTNETDLSALGPGYLTQTVAGPVASLSTVTAIPASDIAAAGSSTQVQFNDAGALGADADLTWDKSTNTLTLSSDVELSRHSAAGKLKVAGGATAAVVVKHGSNAEIGAIGWDGSNNFIVGTQGGVSGGTARDTIVGSAAGAGNGVYLATEDTSRWQVDPSGHFKPFADATYDLGTSSKHARAIFGGALTVSVVTKTHADTPYAVGVSDFTVLADATGGVMTVTLPTPTAGRVLVIKKVDSSANACTVAGTVDGAVNPTLAAQYNSMTIIADGSAWMKIAQV